MRPLLLSPGGTVSPTSVSVHSPSASPSGSFSAFTKCLCPAPIPELWGWLLLNPPLVTTMVWPPSTLSSRSSLRSTSPLRHPLSPYAGVATSTASVALPQSLPPLVPPPAALRRADARRTNIRRTMCAPRSLPPLVPSPATPRRDNARPIIIWYSMGKTSYRADTHRPMGEASCASDRPETTVAVHWSPPLRPGRFRSS